MKLDQLRAFVTSPAFETLCDSLYKEGEGEMQRQRYLGLIDQAADDSPDYAFFSVPGRTELSGSHTDHNLGMILAASIDLDSLALVRPLPGNRVRLFSRGYDKAFEVNLDQLEMQPGEKESTEALIRGVAAGIKKRGGQIGGFEAWVDSRVLTGSGLSSSASIEILLGTILNDFYNNNRFDYIQLAQIGQEAENLYFGKPCGLMDQLACAAGGVVFVDFADAKSPKVERLEVSFYHYGYALAVVDTGGSHADLTEHYASIPREMKSVAALLGQPVLRPIAIENLLAKGPEICMKLGIRPFVRSLHFVNENRRVKAQKEALLQSDMSSYLALAAQSGHSSFESLQNCLVPGAVKDQEIPLALSLAQSFLEGEGACRVHGGGFAGTIQVYLPVNKVEGFKKLITPFFGEKALTLLRIRNMAAGKLDLFV
ncbi:MAG: galactokinase [Spirochaetales bacterium]|nr:galactokinase [Spirochaetales bacterium]